MEMDRSNHLSRVQNPDHPSSKSLPRDRNPGRPSLWLAFRGSVATVANQCSLQEIRRTWDALCVTSTAVDPSRPSVRVMSSRPTPAVQANRHPLSPAIRIAEIPGAGQPGEIARCDASPHFNIRTPPILLSFAACSTAPLGCAHNASSAKNLCLPCLLAGSCCCRARNGRPCANSMCVASPASHPAASTAPPPPCPPHPPSLLRSRLIYMNCNGEDCRTPHRRPPCALCELNADLGGFETSCHS